MRKLSMLSMPLSKDHVDGNLGSQAHPHQPENHHRISGARRAKEYPAPIKLLVICRPKARAQQGFCVCCPPGTIERSDLMLKEHELKAARIHGPGLCSNARWTVAGFNGGLPGRFQEHVNSDFH